MTTTIAERSGELSRVVTVSENTRSTVLRCRSESAPSTECGSS